MRLQRNIHGGVSAVNSRATYSVGRQRTNARIESVLFEEACDEVLQSRPAMAHGILVDGVELSRCAPERRHVKVRIVSKTSAPARLVDDFTMPATFGDQ